MYVGGVPTKPMKPQRLKKGGIASPKAKPKKMKKVDWLHHVKNKSTICWLPNSPSTWQQLALTKGKVNGRTKCNGKRRYT